MAGRAFDDKSIGELWRQNEASVQPDTCKRNLIRKLVEERARYHAAHYKPEALNEALKDFGIKPEDVS
jgi:hypothetical protein